MIHITKQLDGSSLGKWKLDGFPDETVVVVPMGDVLVECAFKIMDRPSHTAPTDPPRAATLDEIAECVYLLGESVSVQGLGARGQKNEEGRSAR